MNRIENGKIRGHTVTQLYSYTDGKVMFQASFNCFKIREKRLKRITITILLLLLLLLR